jgi:hypothetical protein
VRALWLALFAMVFIFAELPIDRNFSEAGIHAASRIEMNCDCETAGENCRQSQAKCDLRQCVTLCGVQLKATTAPYTVAYGVPTGSTIVSMRTAAEKPLRTEHPPFRPPRA